MMPMTLLTSTRWIYPSIINHQHLCHPLDMLCSLLLGISTLLLWAAFILFCFISCQYIYASIHTKEWSRRRKCGASLSSTVDQRWGYPLLLRYCSYCSACRSELLMEPMWLTTIALSSSTARGSSSSLLPFTTLAAYPGSVFTLPSLP